MIWRCRACLSQGYEPQLHEIDTAVQVLATYHVAATTVLIVDSVAWLVLMPMLSHQHPSPDAAWRKLFFCWTGYNQVSASLPLSPVCLPSCLRIDRERVGAAFAAQPVMNTAVGTRCAAFRPHSLPRGVWCTAWRECADDARGDAPQ